MLQEKCQATSSLDIFAILYDEGIEMCDLSIYNRLYFAFQDSEIEKINDAAIAQDLINKVNRGEI